MILQILSNISIITMSGLSGGIAVCMCYDTFNIIKYKFIKNERFNPQINNIAYVFNTGFYIGAGLGLSYILTGKPFVYIFFDTYVI